MSWCYLSRAHSSLSDSSCTSLVLGNAFNPARVGKFLFTFPFAWFCKLCFLWNVLYQQSVVK